MTLRSGIALPPLASIAGPGVAASLVAASHPGKGSHPQNHLALQWESSRVRRRHYRNIGTNEISSHPRKQLMAASALLHPAFFSPPFAPPSNCAMGQRSPSWPPAGRGRKARGCRLHVIGFNQAIVNGTLQRSRAQSGKTCRSGKQPPSRRAYGPGRRSCRSRKCGQPC